MIEDKIEVIGARVHNLKNIDLTIPRNQLVVFTGKSGSGKSSLAFDTIHAEGQRRYLETFNAYARQFLGNQERPEVDKITGLSPVVSIEQKTTSKNPRSTVGTITEIYDYLRLLFARTGIAYSYNTGEKMVKYSDDQIIKLIQKEFKNKKINILSPIVRSRKGHYRELLRKTLKKGYVKIRIDGEIRDLIAGMKLDRYVSHDIEIVIDRLKVKDENFPEGDIEIKYTGLRAGEKLYEELLIGDNVSKTENPLIMRAKEDKFEWVDLKSLLDKLSVSNKKSDHNSTREILKKIVSGFSPEGTIKDILYTN